jgi:hypothetical protein
VPTTTTLVPAKAFPAVSLGAGEILEAGMYEKQLGQFTVRFNVGAEMEANGVVANGVLFAERGKYEIAVLDGPLVQQDAVASPPEELNLGPFPDDYGAYLRAYDFVTVQSETEVIVGGQSAKRIAFVLNKRSANAKGTLNYLHLPLEESTQKFELAVSDPQFPTAAISETLYIIKQPNGKSLVVDVYAIAPATADAVAARIISGVRL